SLLRHNTPVPLLSSSLFSLSSPVAPLPLHSFPTRRSSDLCSASRATLAGSRRCTLRAASVCTSSARYRRWRGASLMASERIKPRSEEHTSELQSLTNIVCRLLLEKTKRQSQIGYRINS